MCTPHDSSDKPDTRQTQQKTTNRYCQLFSLREFLVKSFTLTFNLNAIHWQIVFRIYIHFFRDNEILYCYIALNAMRGSFFPVLLCEENKFEISRGRGSPPPP